ncbi:MAG: hypothetical protein Q8M16_12855 [Pirellulaceae bacterium]|nr:hypothetical protein [Pirellulaceae bacterium]
MSASDFVSCVQGSIRCGLGITLLIGLFSVFGCSNDPAGDDHTGDVYDHEEIPAHKPLHFAAAIDALQKKMTQGTWTQEDFNVVIDLVKWIPELAAESDLLEAEWLQINDLTKQLLQPLQALQASTAQAKERTPASLNLTAADRQTLQTLLDELQTWCRYKTLHEPIYDGRDAHDHAGHDH